MAKADYNRVALFVRVVRAGSFTTAGEQVGLPKSSVSRSISQLEDELGVLLLHRTTRKLALTDAGQAYFDAVNAAVVGLDDAEEAVRELGAEPRGRVRVTAPTDIGVMGMAAAFASFARKHPAIRVELALTSRTVDLVAEGFDLAIRAGRLDDSSLVARRVGETMAAIFASPAYLRRRGRPKTLADLESHDWVLYRAHEGRSIITMQTKDGSEHTFTASASLVADELSFCLHAAIAGAGLALLPVAGIEHVMAAGELVLVTPQYSQSGHVVHVVMPYTHRVPTRVALVRDFLVDYLTQRLAESQAKCTAHGRVPARAS